MVIKTKARHHSTGNHSDLERNAKISKFYFAVTNCLRIIKCKWLGL
jgi:hypothetical protein